MVGIKDHHMMKLHCKLLIVQAAIETKKVLKTGLDKETVHHICIFHYCVSDMCVGN